MASLTFKPLQQTQLHLSSSFHRNYSYKFHLSFDPLSLSHAMHKLKLQVKLRVAARSETRLPGYISEELPRNNVNTVPQSDFSSGFSCSSYLSRRASGTSLERNHIDTEEPIQRSVILKDRNSKVKLNSENRKQLGSGVSSERLKRKKLVKSTDSNCSLKVFGEDAVKKEKKRTKKPKDNSPVHILRIGLDMCSKRGDVIGAIKLYDLAKREGIKMAQYHYAVLLYLCSSAATGTVQPAKSGSRGRTLNPGDNSVVDPESSSDLDELVKKGYDKSKFHEQNRDEKLLVELPEKIVVDVDGNEDSINSNNEFRGICEETLEDVVESMKKKAKADYSDSKDEENSGFGIEVSREMKRIALQKGFQIHSTMRKENVPMNEATFTSVARMAMAFGDGDMAFDMVKQMKENGINPKLRSYGPALAIFCNNRHVDKAFVVEKHMIDNGICPEEPELGALLKVSLETGKNDKVYYVMHKLRTSVRQVSLGTGDLIERWFKSKVASRVGKRKLDQEMILDAMEKGGGGWHGKGWLGRGKWNVYRSRVDSDGLCTSCGEKLVTIDLDPQETENFAECVASIAAGRERNSSFQKFQKWLDYYGPFEAVVDAANVGLYAQRTFKPSKVNAVVNGIRRMLPSKRWPLIVLHNRRISGEKMNEPLNRALIDKWRNADALYATPTGSNDDWYWLYAAIKCRGLLVTNDEMRDHLFQLLGNDFFPKWKERHQVHFSFDETGPIFRMPPPFSVVIQESEKGHWHIPIVSELENEVERIWLCCSRSNSSLAPKDSPDVQKECQNNRETKIVAETKYPKLAGKEELQQLSKKVKTILFSSQLGHRASIVPELEAAEENGGCLIDFQI